MHATTCTHAVMNFVPDTHSPTVHSNVLEANRASTFCDDMLRQGRGQYLLFRHDFSVRLLCAFSRDWWYVEIMLSQLMKVDDNVVTVDEGR